MTKRQHLKMEYNTQKERMDMPEYGRYVHDMIAHAVSLPDRAERQRCAETIAGIMANMQPQLREQPDYRHRIWDHLAYISGYRLDVDYPYPVTRLGEGAEKPQPLAYPNKPIRQRQYGHLLEATLARLAEMPEGEERDVLLEMTANQMKQSLFNWNRDAMDNEKVAADIAAYTQGRVHLDLDHFRFEAVQTMPRQTDARKKKKR